MTYHALSQSSVLQVTGSRVRVWKQGSLDEQLLFEKSRYQSILTSGNLHNVHLCQLSSAVLEV